MIKTYSELIRLSTFDQRFNYLNLHGKIGDSNFGFDRWINQQFYRSLQWKSLRHQIIVRDNGCDLGIDGYEIHGRLHIHHMNPMVKDDIVDGRSEILDPEYLITVSLNTHNAIHFGNKSLLPKIVTERKRGDTKLW